MILERATMSMQAHKQGWQSQHFEKTKYGKKLAKLKDIHKGEICVVVGNGPSLCAADLQKLHEKKIATFGTNRIFKIFDQTDWRPTYYVSEDANILRGVQQEVSELNAEKKFIPINLKWYETIEISNATYFYMDYNGKYEDSYGISMNIDHAVRCRSTVTITCLQLAIYMGYSKIYLIGVDHNFAKMIDKDGNVIVDNSIQSNFLANYQSDIPDLGFSIDAATEAYLNVEQLSRKMKNFRVFNATRGGKLEVYERVYFDSLF
jgi:hypothetical protein